MFIGLRTPVSWTDRDRENLAIFFKTQTGQRFVNLFHNQALTETQGCVFANGDPGKARGWQLAFVFLCQSSALDPLRAVQNTGRVALTETKIATSEDDEETGNPSDVSTVGLGLPIGP
jgi:hypothetical protein